MLMYQVTLLSQWNYNGGHSALTYGQSDKLIQIQTPVDELTTSGKQINPSQRAVVVLWRAGGVVSTFSYNSQQDRE